MTATTVSRIQGIAIFKLITTKTSTSSMAMDTTIEEEEALGSRGPSTRGARQILINDDNTLSGVWVKGFVHLKEAVYNNSKDKNNNNNNNNNNNSLRSVCTLYKQTKRESNLGRLCNVWEATARNDSLASRKRPRTPSRIAQCICRNKTNFAGRTSTDELFGRQYHQFGDFRL